MVSRFVKDFLSLSFRAWYHAGMWRFIRELWRAPLVQYLPYTTHGHRRASLPYPSYDATRASLGPRYREMETPFGTIGYMGSAIDLADGGMGAEAEYCDV